MPPSEMDAVCETIEWEFALTVMGDFGGNLSGVQAASIAVQKD